MRLIRNWVLSAIAIMGGVAFAAQEKAPPADHEGGLLGEYFVSEGLQNYMEIPPGKKPTFARIDKQINFGNVDGDFYGARMKDNFHVRWTGVIHAEKDGKYEFVTESDDGSKLFIDDKLVLDNGGVHPVQAKTGTVELKAGEHKIKIEFFQGGGGAACVVGWHPPGGKKEVIPANALFHPKSVKPEYDETAWKARPEGSKETTGSAKLAGGGGGGAPQKGNPIHEKMDYGPFVSGSIESSYPSGGNFAIKGLAIRVGDKKQASVAFDTELLRVSVGWTGEWLKLDYGRDGLEGHPTLRGTPKFGTKGGAIGWANKAGEFDVAVKDKDGKDKRDDPRQKTTNGKPEGPLPADWARYKGVYVDGGKAIVHYTVGEADVLEQPGFDDSDGLDVFSRTFQISNISAPLKMLVIEDDAALGAELTAKKSGVLKLKDDAAIVAALSGAPDATRFTSSQGANFRRIILEIPAQPATQKFMLKIARVGANDLSKFESLIDKKVPGSDIDAVTKSGGAKRWEPIEVKGELAKEDDKGAYVVDSITVPYKNPYDAYMRITGVDFFKDGRAAVCTMSGDVWVISGIDKTLEKVVWQRFATGLFATTGLKIVNDQVHTLGRDQITRFYDYNKDGEADYYECFNNDCTVGTDYHEFAHDLHTDTDGNFYYMKGSNLGAGGGKYHGCMIRVAKDGKSSEIFCKGFRAPNGMCVGPNNEITTGDNQGNWTPSSPINWIKQGGFYGFQLDSYPETKTGPRLNPLCWVPYKEDNSCGGQAWSGPNWGPLSNRLLHMSYGQSKLFNVIIEKYNDDVQGGVVKFPLNFMSGVMRARFSPTDGQMYVVGMRGWQTNGAKDGTFQRVRYTGKPVHMPLEAKTSNNGLTLTFASPLDKESAEDKDAWSCERFNIHYTSDYGSPEYSLNEPEKKGHDKVEVKSVKLNDDGKTVKVELADMKLCTNLILKYKIKAKDGTTITQELDYTINFIPGGERSPGLFPPAPKKKDEKKAAAK